MCSHFSLILKHSSIYTGTKHNNQCLKNGSEKILHSVFHSRAGEILGSRNDFKMNTCTIHASATMLLDMSHLSLLENSIRNHPSSTPHPTLVITGKITLTYLIYQGSSGPHLKGSYFILYEVTLW